MKKIFTSILMLSLILCFANYAQAQTTIASDNAGNYDGDWEDGSNEGTGFEPWNFIIDEGSGFAGTFLADPADRELTGLDNPSFHLFADGAGASANVDRPFSDPLAVNSRFTVVWGMNWDTDTADGNKGIILFSDTDEIITINNSNSSAITINGDPMFNNYGTQAITFNFQLLNETTLRVFATGRDGSEEYDEEITISGAPDRVRFYATQMAGGNNRQPVFNNLAIVELPEITDPVTDATDLTAPLDEAEDISSLASFSWEPTDNAISYDIQISTESDFSEITTDRNQESTSYTRPNGQGLRGATTYYWRVRGRNTEGEGPWSEERSFTTVPNFTVYFNNPDEWENVYAYAFTPGQYRAWEGELMTAPEGESVWYSYEIPETFSEIIFNNGAGDQTADLSRNTTGWYDGNEEEWYDVDPFVTGTPGIPDLVAPDNNAQDILLAPRFTWNTADNVVTYDLQIATNMSFSETDLVTEIEDLTSTTVRSDVALDFGEEYFWRVRGKNSEENGDWSETRSFTLVDEPSRVVYGSGNGGFGGTVSGSAMAWTEDDGDINATFYSGPGDFNDVLVIYLSTGVDGRASINNEVNDSVDSLRYAVSAISDNNGARSVNFPDGFEATHAIAISSNGSALFEIPATGTVGNNGLNLISDVDATLSDVTDESFTFSFSLDDIGITPLEGSEIRYVATYLNGTNGFMSNEGYGGPFPTDNVGDVNLTLTVYESFTTNVDLTTLIPDFVNLNAPGNVERFVNESFTASAYFYLNSFTDNDRLDPQDVSVWFGLSGSDSDPKDWDDDVWFEAEFNEVVDDSLYSYEGSISSEVDTLFYVASRFQIGEGDFYYGGYSAPEDEERAGGFWDADTAGNGQITFKPEPIDPPGLPVLASPANDAEEVLRPVTFTWNPGENAQTYTIQIRTTGDLPVLTDSTGIADTTVTIAGLEPVTEYLWRVKSINAAGESDWTGYRSFTTFDDVPDAPSLLSPDNRAEPLATTITFEWEELNNAESYQFQLVTDNMFDAVAIDSASITATELEISGLDNNQNYFWRVRGSNAAGNGAWSDSFQFRTIKTAPGSVTLSGPANDSTGIKLPVSFSWHQAVDAESYQLQVSTDSGFSTRFDSTGIADTSFSVSGLERETAYYWRVRSENEAGTSDWSAVWTLETIQNPPGAVTIISPEFDADTDTSVVLTWAPADAATEYEIQISGIPSFTRNVFEGAATDTTITVDGLQDFIRYYWRIRAVNDGGNGEWSNSRFFTGAPSSADGEINIPTEFVLNQNFPNPFNPTTRIQFGLPEQANVKIEVFSVDGRRVAVLMDENRSAGYHSVQFDASQLSSGVYLYRLQTSSRIITRKMLLVK